jgi:hypothetical protein
LPEHLRLPLLVEVLELLVVVPLLFDLGAEALGLLRRLLVKVAELLAVDGRIHVLSLRIALDPVEVVT